MQEVQLDLQELSRLMGLIEIDGAAKQWTVPGYKEGAPVEVPFNAIETPEGQVHTLLRLLRRGIAPEMIRAFAMKAGIQE
ncbi:hypothetical protein HGQ98_04810 [Achromobacter ruhlandii]|uniref:Uncharacterized protein n=1 Tax=Achromobacter ruhlandii TaxID=72557 RepID=A0A848NE75_9BURK|nr:hypothetical protein [Achromobacter ruhlandii]NMU89200.1 hypothetical protein [Achromobacter ruhlandii]